MDDDAEQRLMAAVRDAEASALAAGMMLAGLCEAIRIITDNPVDMLAAAAGMAITRIEAETWPAEKKAAIQAKVLTLRRLYPDRTQ